MSYVIVDIETTGLSRTRHKVTEVACAKVKDGKIIKEFQTLINPMVEIPSFITRLTGIDNGMVKDAPPIEAVIPDIMKFLGNDVFVAHNASFDFGFLDHNAYMYTKNPIQNKRLCTRKLANRLLPELRSKKLSNICEHFGIVNTNAHRAMSDVYATVAVFNNFIQILNKKGFKGVEQVIEFERLPKKRCLSLLAN